MIKRIIFDLDNTILMWKDEYYGSLPKTFELLNIPYDNNIIQKLKEAVDNYELEYNIFDKETMTETFCRYANIELPNNFVDTWINFLKECYPKEVDKELVDTLEYLSNKYELVVLTNWFTEQQAVRLKNANLLKYFKEVIGTDQVLNKPNKEAYLKASYPYNLDECIMIGDSLNIDIKGALNIGMDAIYLDNNGSYNGDIKNIKQLKKLKEML